MSDLRIKVKYLHFEIELEGDSETVNKQFKEIKENGLGNLFGKNQLDSTRPLIIEDATPVNEIKSISPVSSNGLPSLTDVIMKLLPATETEWVLIYAFYASDQGNKTFSHADIVSMYESTNRSTPNRKANLSNNIKQSFKSGYFSALNTTDYILTAPGKEASVEIVQRTKGTVMKSPTKSSKQNVNEVVKKEKNLVSKVTMSQNFKVLTDLNLRPKDNLSLIDFANQYKHKSNPEKVLIIVYYLREKLNIPNVSANHIYTGLKELKEKIPPSLYQVIVNTKNRNAWIKFDNTDNINCTIQGSNYIEHDLIQNS